MPTRRALHRWLPIALAFVLAGCPAPTGRHRGIVDGAGGVCSTVAPTPGTTCTINGDQCVFSQPCGIGGFTNLACTCIGSTWQCSQDMRCNMPPIDAGPVECPSTRVLDHDPCASRQGGLYCPGVGRTCDDSGVISTNCFCTGSRWSCRGPECGSDAGDTDGGGDASSVMCPDLAPITGDRCMPGVQCVYPDDTCPWSCLCDPGSGVFFCQTDCSADAGPGDSGPPDASFDP